MNPVRTRHTCPALSGAVLLAGHTVLAAMGTAFTYQGRLVDEGNVANGSYDLKFSLCEAVTGGVQVGATVTNTGVVISNGFFVATLDFGTNAFDGSPRWLEIGVRKETNDFTVLSPRQPVTPAPYAMTAASLSTPLPDSQLPIGVARLSASQTFTASNIFSGVLTANNAANDFAGSFRGNGSGLTNLDTSMVTAATNDLNTALVAKIVAATNAPWIASTNLVVAATNSLNASLVARIVAATNAPWIASTNAVAVATNDLNTALVVKIGAATNVLWSTSTNWIVAQGYQTTNGLTRKAIFTPTPSNGTNYVVDFTNEVVQMTATNHITLVQSTNRPGAGWYGECVWYIQGGATNWVLRVNTNWIGVGTLATNTPYPIASNKLTIVALSARGSGETNVTYAIGRQE